MPVFLGRTSRLKTGFIHPDFLADETKSILTSVQVNYPQSSNTPLRQVSQRELAGNYIYQESVVDVSFTWLTEYSEGMRLFLRAMQHFQEKTGGIVRNPVIPENTFAYLNSIGFRTNGMNPSQWTMGMSFMNAPNMLSDAFDPLEFFGVTTEESESVLTITEDLDSSHLITEKNFALSMRADMQSGLKGYRNIKFGECILSESLTTLDGSYIPVWEMDQYVYSDTVVEQQSRNASESGPRTYAISRQAHLIPTGQKEVGIGW